MVSEFFGRRREGRISTAGCGYKMAVSVTETTAKLGSPVMLSTDLDVRTAMRDKNRVYEVALRNYFSRIRF